MGDAVGEEAVEEEVSRRVEDSSRTRAVTLTVSWQVLEARPLPCQTRQSRSLVRQLLLLPQPQPQQPLLAANLPSLSMQPSVPFPGYARLQCRLLLQEKPLLLLLLLLRIGTSRTRRRTVCHPSPTTIGTRTSPWYLRWTRRF